MNTGSKRSALSYIPGYSNNAVIQLIFASALGYVMISLLWAVMMLIYQGGYNFNTYIIPNLSLSTIEAFKSHWWTLLVYGWLQYPHGFMEMLSNMLWLYCFGSVVQMLVGHKQVIPMYIYCMLVGGAFFLLAQLLPGEFGRVNAVILGPRAGLIGMAAAAVTLTPKYRIFFTDTFSIPLIWLAGIFAVLMLISTNFYLPGIIMLIGGALMGFAYVKLLKAGYRPGNWMYTLTGKIAGSVTPNEHALRIKNNGKRNQVLSKMYEPRNGVSQKSIDDILDKINQKGYNSLSSEEKEILMRVGKE